MENSLDLSLHFVQHIISSLVYSQKTWLIENNVYRYVHKRRVMLARVQTVLWFRECHHGPCDKLSDGNGPLIS